MKTGDLVKVRDFRDQVLERKIVEISGDTIYLCTTEELRMAAALGRPPIVVGFNKQYVVEPK